jgi:hypothetical protein
MKTQAEYQKNFYRKRITQAMEYLGSACVECDIKENLEFDHIDPATKHFNVTNGYKKAKEVFWNEVKKCQLLCSVHHKEKTTKENSVNHGEGLTGKRNCRCLLCAPLKNAYRRNHTRAKRDAGASDDL